MRVLVTGAAGMVGARFAWQILSDGRLGDHPVDTLHLVDVVEPTGPRQSAVTVETGVCDISDRQAAEALIASKPDVIVHLAAIVSGEAEADFEKGYRINLDGTRHLIEAIRLVGGAYRPRFVFASSIAVFGPPFEERIGDDFLLAPLTSYGTQKAIAELLISDYSRRGFLNGISIRLPTIVVRPGKPNRAASSFFSGIVREPLAGQDADLPVGEEVRHFVASPRSAVGFLRHAATMDLGRLGARRALTMPGLSVSVAQMIETLEAIAGETVAARIRRVPDETIMRIVSGWARDFDTQRALDLGFTADRDFASIVMAHIADEGIAL